MTIFLTEVRLLCLYHFVNFLLGWCHLQIQSFLNIFNVLSNYKTRVTVHILCSEMVGKHVNRSQSIEQCGHKIFFFFFPEAVEQMQMSFLIWHWSLVRLQVARDNKAESVIRPFGIFPWFWTASTLSYVYTWSLVTSSFQKSDQQRRAGDVRFDLWCEVRSWLKVPTKYT